jgi:hypothetical protein
MDSVYVETTVVGHLAGRSHPDPLVEARRASTRTWWTTRSAHYQLFISQLVLDECSAGDPSAAAERLREIGFIDRLAYLPKAEDLANALMADRAIPASEPRDAFHIAITAVHGVRYLLTWNCRHIANAALRNRIEMVCRKAGVEPPIICTPDELMGIRNE